MDESSAPDHESPSAPIFGAYRRGYDPEQVDRYVGDQQRRLDEALHRASEAERKLGAAIGQLRELHRRVAVLESAERSPQAPALDTLGERVQRILNEAWEGAYALRQSAEQEMIEQRQRAELDAAEVTAAAEQRSAQIEAEAARRATAMHERIEHERSRAVAQISYLHDQRKLAVDDMLRLKDVIEAAVREVAPTDAHTAPSDRPIGAAARRVPAGSGATDADHDDTALGAHGTPPAIDPEDEARARREAPVRFQRPRLSSAEGSVTAPAETPTAVPGTEAPVVAETGAHSRDRTEPPKTMPVHRLRRLDAPATTVDSAALVRDHRAAEHAELDESTDDDALDVGALDVGALDVGADVPIVPSTALYDFEAD